MNEIIRKRKSIRKYELTGLDAVILDKVRGQIASVIPLYPEIKHSIEIVSKTKGIFGIKAPHYLVFSSEEKNGAYENIGFIGQQMDLFFSESGLGSCWLGMAKPEGGIDCSLPFVISMAFGKPAEPLYRHLSEFKRKSLSEISEGMDERLEAARLAPSGMNAQNWYFVADKGKIHCYCRKPKPMLGFMTNRFSRIDIGIAICHIFKESEEFHFYKDSQGQSKKGLSSNGLIYVGTVG
jgi:hypothetical protein